MDKVNRIIDDKKAIVGLLNKVRCQLEADKHIVGWDDPEQSELLPYLTPTEAGTYCIDLVMHFPREREPGEYDLNVRVPLEVKTELLPPPDKGKCVCIRVGWGNSGNKGKFHRLHSISYEKDIINLCDIITDYVRQDLESVTAASFIRR